jgi:hypothetical protein
MLGPMSMKLARLAACTCALSIAVGCGGSKPPAGGPGDPAAPVPVQSGDDLGPAPDLSAVGVPQDLIAVGRLNRPSQVIDTAAGWMKVPVDWRKEIEREAPGFEAIVDFQAPIDFAMALPPGGPQSADEPLFVVTLGLRSVQGSLEYARKRGEGVERIAPGVYRVGGSDDCVIAASVGAAPARLVCGDRGEDVQALLPYVTRGLPNENLGTSDLHMELRADALKRRFGTQLRQAKLAVSFFLREAQLDDPRFDRPLADAAHALVDELIDAIDDADKLSLDISLRKESSSVDAAMALDFKGQKSWTVQTLLDAGSRSTTPPEMFWRLPKDANVASYGAPGNPKRFDPIRKKLGELLDGWLSHENVPRRARDQMADLLEETGTNTGASVYAQGALPAPAGAAAKSSGDQQREAIRRRLGWYVIGVDEKPEKYKAYFNKLMGIYNDPQLRKMLEKRARLKPQELPPLRSRPGRGAGLAAGTTVYELTLPGKIFDEFSVPTPVMPGKKLPNLAVTKGKPLPIVLVVMPDGERTWLGLSADEKLLSEKLAIVKKADAGATLASREGLSALRTPKVVSGGFLTIASVTDSLESTLLGAGNSDTREIARMLNAMPHHGDTPVPYRMTVTRERGTRLAWAMSAPRPVLEDLGALIPFASQIAGRVGSSPPIGIAVPPTAPPPAPPEAPTVPARPKPQMKGKPR